MSDPPRASRLMKATLHDEPFTDPDWVFERKLDGIRCLAVRDGGRDVKLSVVIPVYNEERWIREVLRRVQAVEIPKEIIIVEDCSKDGTRAILQTITDENVKIFYQEKNQGKGAAQALHDLAHRLLRRHLLDAVEVVLPDVREDHRLRHHAPGRHPG